MWAHVESSAVTEIIAAPRAIEIDGVMHPAALFTVWSDEQREAVGIIPARFAADPASPRDTQVGETTWEIVDGEAVGTRQWQSYQPTAADVIAERARRLALGFDYDFGDGRGIHHIGTTPDDLAGWEEVSTVTSAAIAVGMPQMPLSIVSNTGPVTVTALEWQSILLAAGAFRQPLWAASFALQAMTPIPGNYTDDEHWE